VALSVGGIDVMPLKRARNSALGKSETRGGGGEAGMEADKTRGKGVGEGEALASQDVDEVDIHQCRVLRKARRHPAA
jgi:hypothetical protein